MIIVGAGVKDQAEPTLLPMPVGGPDLLRGAGFVRRLGAAAFDAVLSSLLLVALVETSLFFERPPFFAFWREREIAGVVSEPAGEPTQERIEGGLTRRSSHSRETRVFKDGTLQIYAVIDVRTIDRDGAVHEGRAETLVGESRSLILRRAATVALFIVLPLAAFAAFESSPWQATPGKRLLGLRVVDLDGRRVGVIRAVARQCLKLLDVATSMVTFVIAAVTPRRQTLHDILAGTLVTEAGRDQFGSL